MPLAFATCSAPARTALAIGLPALLVKMARVSAPACVEPNGTTVAIAAAQSAPWRFIMRLPTCLLRNDSRCCGFRPPLQAHKIAAGSASPLTDCLACGLDHVR